jgi:capsular exopolysaccharide synthesis family protein
MSRLEDALTKAEESNGPLIEETHKGLLPASLSTEDPAELSYFSSIYTNFQFATVDAEHPVVVFASAVPKEGVSSMVFYLSQLISTERKTLVVDFNFLSPRLHKLFQTDNIRGLSDVLQGRKSIADCIMETNTPNLDFLPCGPTGAAPFQILGSAPVKKVIADLKARYEVVLLDCPPIRRFPDTAILGSLCDGVILVVKARKTKREVIRYAQGLMDKAGARQLGVILNHVKYWIPGFIYQRL